MRLAAALTRTRSRVARREGEALEIEVEVGRVGRRQAREAARARVCQQLEGRDGAWL